MTCCRNNADEMYVLGVANTIPGIQARLATAAEDCGHQKADVVVQSREGTHYFQVSHTPKSREEQRKLIKRGTHPISTNLFNGLPVPEGKLAEIISGIISASANKWLPYSS